MKHFRYDPCLIADEVRSPKAKAGAMLVQGAALFGLFVLALMIAVAPVAIRFMSAG